MPSTPKASVSDSSTAADGCCEAVVGGSSSEGLGVAAAIEGRGVGDGVGRGRRVGRDVGAIEGGCRLGRAVAEGLGRVDWLGVGPFDWLGLGCLDALGDGTIDSLGDGTIDSLGDGPVDWLGDGPVDWLGDGPADSLGLGEGVGARHGLMFTSQSLMIRRPQKVPNRLVPLPSAIFPASVTKWPYTVVSLAKLMVKSLSMLSPSART
jgi:hypothetical protein